MALTAEIFAAGGKPMKQYLTLTKTNNGNHARYAVLLLAGLFAWLVAMPVLAATPGGQEMDWWTMGMTLLGGLAVFLYGMEQMADALKKVAGDIIETDAVDLAEQCHAADVRISEATQNVLRDLHAAIVHSVEHALRSVEKKDEQTARSVIALKGDINAKVESAAMHQAQRLVADEPNRLETYSVEMDLIEQLKRIYYFAKRIAKTVPPTVLAEQAT